MKRKTRQTKTFDLFAQEDELSGTQELDWPTQKRFPLNHGEHHVEDIVIPDLVTSTSPLIITGFASLDRIIDVCYEIHSRNSGNQTRLLIGQEPFPSRKESFAVRQPDFCKEAESYWLGRGISLTYSAKLIYVVELLKKNAVLARYVSSSRRMHAKIYCGDQAITIGSSNLTEPGFRRQFEANARFEKDGRSNRFDELKLIAENFWSTGKDYKDQLITLLEKLLQVVTWQEALARACAELLEGEWAERYIRGEYLSGSGSLWPSQKQGIAQALTILSTQGSVLIADATGAGKTKMGTYLVGAIHDQILRAGRLRQGKALMVCPPAAESIWKRESNLSGVDLDLYSHGILSNERTKGYADSLDAIKRAQILCIDEGHNFLNFKSQRTQNLLRNMADHVMLFTATPINKSATDLLRIADMLGADNLSESTIKAFKRMLRVKSITRTLVDEEIEDLRREIKRFTVRRTKRQLNRLIDREPETYKDVTGKLCRFPKHRAKIYALNESQKDRKIATRIRSLADQLHGVSYFRKPISMPEIFLKQGISEEKYLQGRLVSAKRLAHYMITSCLRSSRAALIEHIEGTKIAVEFAEIKGFRKGKNSPGMINQINSIVEKLPENRLSINLPVWLSNSKEHKSACADDSAIYNKILELTKTLSSGRESTKVNRLTKLMTKHKLVLAFDSKPITLAVMQKMLRDSGDSEVLAAWGGGGTDREKIISKFALGSTEKDVIGLCSDSLAEAVNLQQASCLVHMDMPSVVRIAEQRVGRVDRMDSPHTQIEIWWPKDAEEFALTSDERFIERYDTVEKLLGSNMPLPDFMKRDNRNAVNVKDIISEAQEQENVWDGIDDAFSPVRNLVEGDNVLVPPKVYELYRHITERVLSRVSLVKSKSSWALFCMTSGSFGSPIWVLLPSINAPAETELSRIEKLLLNRLTSEIEDVKLDKHSAMVLDGFLKQLCLRERELLSKKKQRALSEMEVIIDKLMHLKECRNSVDHLWDVMKMLTDPVPDKQPDWDEVASMWLDVIRPVWFDALSGARNKPLLLKDIRRNLLAKPLWLTKQIETHFNQFPILPPPDERIKACIIGVS